MSFCDNGTDTARQARLLENQRQNNIQAGTRSVNTTFGQFGNDFYNQRAKDYTNYAMPQLYSQLAQANKQGVYGLQNRGLGRSTAANQFGSELLSQANTQKQGIIDEGLSQANQLRQQVEGQRSQLISQLNSSADPTSAAQGALSSAASFSLPSSFTPIGNLFSGLSQIYANRQLGQAYNPANYSSNYGLNNSTVGNRSYSLKG